MKPTACAFVNPSFVVVYLPPAREHQLACDLQILSQPDRRAYREQIVAVTADLERQGLRVEILKSRVWRVVKALSDHGLANTPQGRAAAYAFVHAENQRNHAPHEDITDDDA